MKRFPNLVRLLVVLAMVISLVAITAAPAGAAITNVTAVATPATASSAASYSIGFTTSQNVTAGGTVTVAFPTGVTLPSSIPHSLISLTGVTFPTTGSYVTVSGQQVVVTIPAGQTLAAGACTLLISQGAGIVNPAIAKTVASMAFPVRVNTSVAADSTPVAGYLGTIPSYAVSPVSGQMTDTITVTGKGWTANGAITIGGQLAGAGAAGSDGSFSLSAVPTGTGAKVTVVDGAGQTEVGGSVTWDYTVTAATFTLLPRLEITPVTANPGATVALSGFDFNSGTAGNVTAANIKIGGTAWPGAAQQTLATIDAVGTLDDFTTTLTVPHNVKGAMTVAATDTPAAGTAKTATTTLTVNTPTITLDPASGSPNTLVTITGTNFPASTTIAATALRLGGASWNTVPITIDASGSFTTALRVLTGAKTGSNSVIATTTDVGFGVATASATFTVGARDLTLTPISGPRGTSVTVTAANMSYQAGTTYNVPTGGTYPAAGLYFATVDWNITTNGGGAVISIDSVGNLSPTTLTAPRASGVGAAGAPGPNTVFLADSGGATATGSFEITQPTLTADKTSGAKQDTVTLTGEGWVPGTLGMVTVTFTPAGGSAVTLLVATPDASGKFTAQFAVPLSAATSNTIAATDSTYGNSAQPITFTLGAASVSIDPASGPIGTEITITGSGFNPQTGFNSIQIGTIQMPVVGLYTDTLGKFTTTVTVPALATGAQTVSVNVAGTTATTFFTITSAGATVQNITASIADKLVRVWGYTSATGWQMYDPADPIGSDLTTLTDGSGYWVNVTEAATLVYLGKSRSLEVGWNLMGW